MLRAFQATLRCLVIYDVHPLNLIAQASRGDQKAVLELISVDKLFMCDSRTEPAIREAALQNNQKFIERIARAQNHEPTLNSRSAWHAYFFILFFAEYFGLSLPTLHELYRILEQFSVRRYKIFKRIEMALTSNHLDKARVAIEETLTDKRLFNDLGVRPEYYSMSEKAFGLLTPSSQKRILRWIQAGLDRRKLAERGISSEEVERINDYWRLERLTPLREHLPPKWLKVYETLEKRFGPPPHPQYPVYSGGAFSIASKSPKSTEELEALPVNEVIEYLKSWKPESVEHVGPFGASEEGLGSVLTSLVSKNPEAFIKHLPELKKTDPTYVRAAIEGFEGALQSSKGFDWAAVLELCLWVVLQPIVIPGRIGDNWTRDKDWRWTRNAIVSLIEKGFRKKSIPSNQRDALWQVIRVLADEPDTDCVDYRTPASKDRDVWGNSINRTQARAIRTVIMYIEWCRDNLAAPEFSFQLVPEVTSLLEHHLNAEFDPSLDIRLIYGEFLPFQAFRCHELRASNNEVLPLPFGPARITNFVDSGMPCTVRSVNRLN